MPWQACRDPYRVWLSEIMLQQTQVATVRAYYTRFLRRFPTLAALARAPLAEVLALWAGLGYYARARQAHACARLLVERHGGRFPRTARELETLPGIGPSTAAAIAAFCHGERAAILDGNVKRVLARHAAIDGDPASAATRKRLLELALERLPPVAAMPAYTQAIMDLGATVCTRAEPRCERCPVAASCAARRQGRTAELPTRVAARARPARRVFWLLALHHRAALLEERPASGVWGGLLAPPQFAGRARLARAAESLGAAPARPLTERRHAFTHFTLAVTPCVAELRAARRPTTRRGQRWLALARIEDAALPAPVLALLRELRDGRAV